MPQNVQRAYELVRQQNEQKQTSENSPSSVLSSGNTKIPGYQNICNYFII